MYPCFNSKVSILGVLRASIDYLISQGHLSKRNKIPECSDISQNITVLNNPWLLNKGISKYHAIELFIAICIYNVF